jgi:eukaryotic-like serine/threonine-protein kinase
MELVDVIGARLDDGDLVIRELGRGAYAHVYLVSDGLRVRALKLLRAGDDARACHELAIAGGFDHPHVNRVDAVVECRGRPGLLMPFVPGRRLLARSHAPRGRAAYLDAFDGVLQALAYLHEGGVLHRDLKPENVLVDAIGRARVIDFDLAVRMHATTRPGVYGTIAYLSPEQARGDPSVPASDVYAAGVMLYGALTGQVPFTGTVAEVVTQHREVVAEPPSALDPSLAPLDDLLGRMLAKRPTERFADGAATLDAFREARRALHEAPGVVPHRAGRMPA